jgi:ubiquitin C-terminal hydrolase
MWTIRGATCYLNSLLQALYLTPEFRQLLFDLDDDELGLSHYHIHEQAEAQAKAEYEQMTDEQKKAHKAAEALKSVEVSEERIAEFTAMGMDRVNVIRTLRKFPAASQQDAALEYLFSHDFSMDPPEPEASASKPKRLYKRIPIEFRRFFASLQLGAQSCVGTEGITKSFGWDAKEGQASVQHDIQELYIRLIEALSGSLAGLSGERRMESLYKGSMRTRTTCSVCGNVSSRMESLYNFNVHVKGLKNLRESLTQLVTPELLDGSNSYHCHSDVCKKKVRAWRQDCIATLPPLLTLALNRHEYNKKTWQRVKVNDRLAFPLILDMQPYQEDVAAKTRQQLEADELKQREEHGVKSQPESDVDIAIANSLKSSEQLKREADAAAKQTDNGKSKGKQQQQQQQQGKKAKKGQKGASHGGFDNETVDADELVEPPNTGLEASIFDPNSPLLYDLFAVVVHAGGAHGGHYFAYVHDVVAHNNYLVTHPEARDEFEAFARDPTGASGKTIGYNGDATKSRHPSFWYELNDSNVTSISFDKIASQYGGKRQCAYILMYRQRGLDTAPICQGDGPTVPPALQERVARFNSQLDEERAIYDTISNEVEIELHDEREFSVHAGQLYPRDFDPAAVAEEEKAEEERRALLAMEDAANGNGMDGLGLLDDEPTPTKEQVTKSNEPVTMAPLLTATVPTVTISAPPRRFVVDQRITVPELHTKVREYLAAESAALVAKGEIPPPAIPEKLVLNQLSLKLRPPHQVEGYLSLDDPLDAPATTAADVTQVGKKKKGKPNPKTLEQLGFSAVQQLLVWNGRTINDVPFTTGTKKDQVLHVHCVLFGSDAVSKAQSTVAAAAAESDDAVAPLILQPTVGAPANERVEFFLTVNPTTNVAQLSVLLESRIGIPADSLQLLYMHPVTKVIKPLPLGSDDALKPLKVHGVVNHSWVGVELKQSTGTSAADEPKASAARVYFSELQQCVKLVVLNGLPAASGAASPTPEKIELEALKSSTVLALKQQVLIQLASSYPSLSLNEFRLRKVTGLDKAGALLLDESASLAKSDLAEDDMRVRAEPGALPNKQTHIDLLITLLANINVGGGGNGSDANAEQPKQALAKLVDRVPFVAEQSSTIKSLKTALLNHFGLSHRSESAFCLYRGHATYDEHAKPFTSEFMTLSGLQMEQSSWLWLEEGEVPQTGMVQLDIVQCSITGKNEPSSSASAAAECSSPSNDPTLSLASWRELQEPLSLYVPSDALAAVAVSPQPDSAIAADSTANAESSLVVVSSRPSYHTSPLFTLPFSSNDTLLELKQALYSYPDSPFGSALSPAHLRVRLSNRADGLGKWLNGDDKTLKKQSVASDKRLLVQILPEPELNISSGALLLRMCTAVPSPDGGVRVGPHALQELTFDDGEYPQLSALQRVMAAVAGISASDKVGVLKWLSAGKEETEEDKKDGGKSSSSVASTQTTSASVDPSSPSTTASPPILKGWVVLFPDGPDPADLAGVAAAATAAEKGKGGAHQGKGQKGQQTQQQKGGGKKGKQQSGDKSTDASALPIPIPAWSLKSGIRALHEDDVLMIIRLADFGLSTLDDLSTLTRVWGLTSAPPPGYTLVAKERADELERAAERERQRKAAPKRQEVELKIEY